ncbi:MAG: protein translocase subunit SecF [Trebonia sp.]|jgi:preprotein translocase subunit SecF
MMAGVGGIAGRLYRGEVSVNFVGRQRTWYTISGLIVLVSAIALAVRRLNFSVEFKGGTIFQFPATTGTSSQVQGTISRIVKNGGGGDSTVQLVVSHLVKLGPQWTVTTKALSRTVQQSVAVALEHAFHVTNPNNMSVQFVGASWGSQITTKALEALIIFLIVIVIYLSIAFEWRMAVAAFVALIHDIVITIGVYALTGFEVSPTTVIGLLTILGYSLYDTVVVFDKVRENTAGLLTTQRSTYSDAANLALNQTLVRSINTSLTALIPVASILFVGAGLLGAGTLKDLSLVLFVGMLSGTYSSIFIATPVLADLKERQPEYKDLAVKVKRRLAGGRRTADTASTPAASAVTPAGTGLRNEEPLVDDEPSEAGRDIDGDNDGVAVSAAAARAADSARPTRPSSTGSRPQPRTGGSAQRRPGAKKKRR